MLKINNTLLKADKELITPESLERAGWKKKRTDESVNEYYYWTTFTLPNGKKRRLQQRIIYYNGVPKMVEIRLRDLSGTQSDVYYDSEFCLSNLNNYHLLIIKEFDIKL